MTSIINKRQQARNERALQDLIKNVPGNDRCADCEARNPGWASWSLGIFLCMRCAALHRKLGVHLSKVKSLSMDGWSNDQVAYMKKTGNIASNRSHNPRNTRPDLPLDADEVDTAMEKFIRSKYQTKTLSAPSSRAIGRTDTGSTSVSSTEDRPPPVPAKNTPRFGATVRAASSTYPMSRSERPLPPVQESNGVVGLSDNNALGHSLAQDEKLAQLRIMGFRNEKKNTTVLRGVNGDFNKAVESLLRLGEGGHASETLRQQLPVNQRPNGAAVESSYTSQVGLGPSQQPVPQPSYSAGMERAQTFPLSNPWNSSGLPTQQQMLPQSTTSVELGFQSLNISQEPKSNTQTLQQSLFPHNTGPFPVQQQHNPFLRTYTPPTIPSNQFSPPQFPFNPQENTAHPFQPQVEATTNPFLRPSRSQNFASSNMTNPSSLPQPQLYSQQKAPSVPGVPQWATVGAQQTLPQAQFLQQAQNSSQPNQVLQYYGQQQPQYSSQSPPVESPSSIMGGQQFGYPFQQQQQQQQQAFYQSGASIPMPNALNPYASQNQQPSAPTYQNQTQPRHDKSSILALYNIPSYVQQVPTQPDAAQLQQVQMQQPQPVQSGQSFAPQRSVSMPLPAPGSLPGGAGNNMGSYNPFVNVGSTAPAPRQGYGGLGHIREESREFTSFDGHAVSRGGNEGGNGRYSPDAFAGLSARYR